MEAALLALGVSLVCASLVPIIAGRLLQGAGLAYLGGVSWGGGLDASGGVLTLIAVGMALVVGTMLLAAHVGRTVVRRVRTA